MNKFLKWKTWNDQLSLLLIVGVPLLWVFATMPPEALTATIVMWVLTIQYYFRRAPAEPPVPPAQ